MSIFSLLSRSASPIGHAATTDTFSSSGDAPAAAQGAEDGLAVSALGEHHDIASPGTATASRAHAATSVAPPPPPCTPRHPEPWKVADPQSLMRRVWDLVNEQPSVAEYTSSVIES